MIFILEALTLAQKCDNKQSEQLLYFQSSSNVFFMDGLTAISWNELHS